MAINSVTVEGRLGKAAEIKPIGDKFVISFSIANNRGFGDRQRTNWIDVEMWANSEAQKNYYLQRLIKGAQVVINGELQQQSWDDKMTGKKRSKLLVKAFDVSVPTNAQTAPQQAYTAAAAQVIPDDDIPF